MTIAKPPTTIPKATMIESSVIDINLRISWYHGLLKGSGIKWEKRTGEEKNNDTDASADDNLPRAFAPPRGPPPAAAPIRVSIPSPSLLWLPPHGETPPAQSRRVSAPTLPPRASLRAFRCVLSLPPRPSAMKIEGLVLVPLSSGRTKWVYTDPRFTLLLSPLAFHLCEALHLCQGLPVPLLLLVRRCRGPPRVPIAALTAAGGGGYRYWPFSGRRPKGGMNSGWVKNVNNGMGCEVTLIWSWWELGNGLWTFSGAYCFCGDACCYYAATLIVVPWW